MGNNLSLNFSSATTSAILIQQDNKLAELKEYVYLKRFFLADFSLSNARLLKTFKCLHNKSTFVVKIYLKAQTESLNEISDEIQRNYFLSKDYQNYF